MKITKHFLKNMIKDEINKISENIEQDVIHSGPDPALIEYATKALESHGLGPGDSYDAKNIALEIARLHLKLERIAVELIHRPHGPTKGV